MTRVATPIDPLHDVLVFLQRFRRGSARFIVGAGGLVHQETVVTVPIQPAEAQDSRLLLVRLQRDYGLQVGDYVEVLNTDNQLNIARITRRS